jgi:hypothetical protein
VLADEQYKWLGREAAERLLRGEPLEAVDADVRAAADRLTGALDALTPAMPPAEAELPGEEAALAAFRKARAERDNEDMALSAGARPHATARSADAGLVRLVRPGPEVRRVRWGRPARFTMAATLAVGMLGGVAVAAAAGVLPTPFRDDRPEPGATVSAPVTPGRPDASPSPEGKENRPAGEPSSGATAGGADGGGTRDDTARGDGATGKPGSKDENSGDTWRGSGTGWRAGVLSACRDVRAGKKLDSDRRRGLEGAAGGKGKVNKYCKGILGDQGDRNATGTSDHRGPGTSGNGDSGSGRDKGGGKDGGGEGKGDGGRGGGGGDRSGTLPGGNGHPGNGLRGNGGFGFGLEPGLT